VREVISKPNPVLTTKPHRGKGKKNQKPYTGMESYTWIPKGKKKNI
jgi:hypothetical protein